MVNAGRTTRWTLLGVVALGVVVAVTTPLPAGAQELDERLAIDFQATKLDGTPFNGTGLKGHVVLLDFWAVWCRPCLEAFPELNGLAHELADHDVEVIGIAVHSGSWEEVADFLEGYDVQYPVVVADEELVYRLDVIGYPTYLLVGQDGAIYKRYVGELPNLADRIHARCRDAPVSDVGTLTDFLSGGHQVHTRLRILAATGLLLTLGFGGSSVARTQELSGEAQRVVDYLLDDWDKQFRSTSIPLAMDNLAVEPDDALRP